MERRWQIPLGIILSIVVCWAALWQGENSVVDRSLSEIGTELDFRKRDLRGVDLSGAILDGADFRGADLRGASLKGASVVGAKFQGARYDRFTVVEEAIFGKVSDYLVEDWIRSMVPYHSAHFELVRKGNYNLLRLHRELFEVAAVKHRRRVERIRSLEKEKRSLLKSVLNTEAKDRLRELSYELDLSQTQKRETLLAMEFHLSRIEGIQSH